MLTHKGYTGHLSIDAEDDLITGEVLGTRDVISFGGSSVAEAKESFKQAVDNYLAYCTETGRDPEKPYSGKFLLRMTPRQHRQIDEAAKLAGISVNSLISDRLFPVASNVPLSTVEELLAMLVGSNLSALVDEKLAKHAHVKPIAFIKQSHPVLACKHFRQVYAIKKTAGPGPRERLMQAIEETDQVR